MAQTKTCPRCKTRFTSDSPRKKYCTSACTNAAAQDRYKARQNGTEDDEDGGDDQDVEEIDVVETEEPTATIVDAGDVDVAALYALAVSVGLDPVQVLLEAVLEARRGRSS